jgi:5-methylcytosine-specific restriction endonuclease McrA
MLCQTCSKEHTGSYGSGKYCCRSCANSRVRTEETKQKISDSVKLGIESGKIPLGCSKGVKHKTSVYAYRARKKNAIPADADLDLIKKIYESAPAGYQIDHIIPLSKGGLHHQDNLQYLPSKDNQSKNNRLNYDSKNAIRWQDILT